MLKENKDIVLILSALLLFLSFFYGALSVRLQIFPYSLFKTSLDAAASIKDGLDIDRYNLDIRWPREALEPRGTVVYEQSKTQAGYTLYVSAADTTVRLIDSKGELKHSWNADFSKIWTSQSHLISMSHLDDSYFYLRDFYLYDNGDIILIVSAGGITPWGVGLVKLDKDSKVIWKYSAYVNNDFEMAADGNLYAIVHTLRSDPIALAESKVAPYLEDNIALVSAKDGSEIKAFSLIEAINRSPYKGLLKQIEHDTLGDPTHSNAIEEVIQDVPGVPWLKKGYLLVSVRNVNALVVVDPSEMKVVHAVGLPSRMQHDIDLLPNGRLMIFDNRGDMTDTGYSRVLEFDPLTLNTLWSYEGGQGDAVLESKFWGTQQRLENGNTLIVDAEQGRILEVQPEATTVWEYRSPLVREYDGAVHAAVITHAERVPATLSFLKKGL